MNSGDDFNLGETIAALAIFLLVVVLVHSAVNALYFPEYNDAADAADGEVCLEDNEDLLYEGWTRTEIIRFCKTGR